MASKPATVTSSSSTTTTKTAAASSSSSSNSSGFNLGGATADNGGGFVHKSSFSTRASNPGTALGSNCIRDYFGPTVQMVADCLHIRGGYSTLAELTHTVQFNLQRKVWDKERQPLLRWIDKNSTTNNNNKNSKHNNTTPPQIRAALLLLIQHSIVKVRRCNKHHRKDSKKRDHDTTGAGIGKRKKRTVTQKKDLICEYMIEMELGRLLPRYPRYVEYIRKTVDDMAAALVEQLLVQGRMRTVDAVFKTVQHLGQHKADNADDANNSSSSSSNNNHKYTPRQVVLERFRRLVENGYIQQAPVIVNNYVDEHPDDPDEGEQEFDGGDAPPKKKVKIMLNDEEQAHDGNRNEGTPGGDDANNPTPAVVPSSSMAVLAATAAAASNNPGGEDPAVVALLQSSGSSYAKILPMDAVWRVNIRMFHDQWRSFFLGRLVSDRYGHKVPTCGSLISAALKYVANKQHADVTATAVASSNNNGASQAPGGGGGGMPPGGGGGGAAFVDASNMNLFEPAKIANFLPQAIRDILNNEQGGILPNLAKKLMQLSKFTSPQVIRVIQDHPGQPEYSVFEIATTRLVAYLQERVIHQAVYDNYGETASRIISILSVSGSLEGDNVAERAMVPAKETREALYQLYRSGYIDMMSLQQGTSKMHNPNNMIYLWGVDKKRILKNFSDKLSLALFHLRLRRQHEATIGKHFMERIERTMLEESNNNNNNDNDNDDDDKDGDDDDDDSYYEENENEIDKRKRERFEKGLQRLDTSTLQLDETLLVLKDFI